MERKYVILVQHERKLNTIDYIYNNTYFDSLLDAGKEIDDIKTGFLYNMMVNIGITLKIQEIHK